MLVTHNCKTFSCDWYHEISKEFEKTHKIYLSHHVTSIPKVLFLTERHRAGYKKNEDVKKNIMILERYFNQQSSILLEASSKEPIESKAFPLFNKYASHLKGWDAPSFYEKMRFYIEEIDPRLERLEKFDSRSAASDREKVLLDLAYLEKEFKLPNLTIDYFKKDKDEAIKTILEKNLAHYATCLEQTALLRTLSLIDTIEQNLSASIIFVPVGMNHVLAKIDDPHVPAWAKEIIKYVQTTLTAKNISYAIFKPIKHVSERRNRFHDSI